MVKYCVNCGKSNENYVNKAPKNIVELDKIKLQEEKEKLNHLLKNWQAKNKSIDLSSKICYIKTRVSEEVK